MLTINMQLAHDSFQQTRYDCDAPKRISSGDQREQSTGLIYLPYQGHELNQAFCINKYVIILVIHKCRWCRYKLRKLNGKLFIKQATCKRHHFVEHNFLIFFLRLMVDLPPDYRTRFT